MRYIVHKTLKALPHEIIDGSVRFDLIVARASKSGDIEEKGGIVGKQEFTASRDLVGPVMDLTDVTAWFIDSIYDGREWNKFIWEIGTRRIS